MPMRPWAASFSSLARDAVARADSYDAIAFVVRPRRRQVVPRDTPIHELGRGAVECDALRRGERVVGDEVVERPAEARRDVLQRTDRRPHQARLDLADESFRELVARELRLAEAGVAARRADAVAERRTRLRRRDSCTAD